MKNTKNNKLNIAITANLRKEIETSGKTRTEIAEAIGITKSTVSQYLSGRAQPTLATLSRLCNFLDCSADEILEIKLK
ncbi:MAG: helix-turn-helix transcriptional regulator [Clostridia bacterium]|nr:helix-turn-helix transcriptional regulator [Clostridia bacterium]